MLYDNIWINDKIETLIKRKENDYTRGEGNLKTLIMLYYSCFQQIYQMQ